jgi:NodT family efflux transporter outer membrane factor (OMF) lipoprotein
MSKQILRIAIVSTLATLAACATSPEFKRPAAPAVERYSESAGESAQLNGQTTQQQIDFGSQLPAQWWRLFQSQELNGIVERALANNQTLVAAQASVKQAQALTEAKTGERYPEIDMTASSGRQKYGQQFLGPLAASAPPFTYYAFGPNVSYTLDYAGGISHAVEEQRALTEYQARQLQAAQLSVTGNVVLQALEVAARQAEISALEELLADDRRNLEMIEAAFTAGSVSRVDVLSAQSQLASDTTQLPQLRQQLSVARHALAALSGDTPTNAIIPAFQLSAFVLPEKLPVSLPSERNVSMTVRHICSRV